MEDNDDMSDDGRNIWSNLLQEVKEKSSKTRHIPNSLLVLGSELSGKSQLIARLQKADSKNGVGLEFEFIDVKDESMDENKQLNVWISSGDTFHSNLLKYALDENNFEFTLCMITVSFAEPWTIIESLEQWLDILKKHVDRLKLESQNLASLKESLSRHFQEYVEPDIGNVVPVTVGKRRDTDFNHLHPAVTDEPDKICVPLGDGVFDKNLGIPIIVVITKTDTISTLEEDFQYDDDKFDFIQMNIRKLCLKYGAALCYTSLKDGHNCEMLLRYILHRCYGFPFIDTASVIEKDGIFIPAGWDNANKINILAENLPESTRNQKFDDFISKPLSLVRAAAQTRMSEPEMAEDEQVFLMKQQAQLQRIKASTDPNIKQEPVRGGQLPKGQSVAVSGPGRNRKNISGQSSVGVNNPNPSAQGNEGVLANFFSSLLNKRAVPGEPSLQSQQSTVEDSGKQMEVISEAEKIVKEEIKEEEIPDNIMTNGEEKSSPAVIITVDTNVKRIDENIVIENSNESQISEVYVTDIYIASEESEMRPNINEEEVINDDFKEPINEGVKFDEFEVNDENSTGKQISELEERLDENEIKIEIENHEIVEKSLILGLEDTGPEKCIDNETIEEAIEIVESDESNIDDSPSDIDKVCSVESTIANEGNIDRTDCEVQQDIPNIEQGNIYEEPQILDDEDRINDEVNNLSQSEDTLLTNVDNLAVTSPEENAKSAEMYTIESTGIEIIDTPENIDNLDLIENKFENSINTMEDHENNETEILSNDIEDTANYSDIDKGSLENKDIALENQSENVEINGNTVNISEMTTADINNADKCDSTENLIEGSCLNTLDQIEESSLPKNAFENISVSLDENLKINENIVNISEMTTADINSNITEEHNVDGKVNDSTDQNDGYSIEDRFNTNEDVIRNANSEDMSDNFREKSTDQTDNKETYICMNIENEGVAGDDSKNMENQNEQT